MRPLMPRPRISPETLEAFAKALRSGRLPIVKLPVVPEETAVANIELGSFLRMARPSYEVQLWS
jgi:hypothetical protein